MSGFDHIDTWVFDLDNTLYPASCRLFDQIDKRITEYVVRVSGKPHAEARAWQKDMFNQHGTTLRGLMIERDVDPHDFLEHAHDIDYSPVQPDDVLAREIARLPGRRLVFTSGTVAHAKNAMNRLGVTSLFDGFFDIVSSGFVPKPQRKAYDDFLAVHGVDPRRAAMFEDLERNLAVPHDIGMTTVLVTDAQNKDAHHLNTNSDGAHVHHRTDNLPGFLQLLKFGEAL